MKSLFYIAFCMLAVLTRAQYSYDFVRQPQSVAASVAGGNIVSTTKSDLSVWMDNPGLMDSTIANHAAISINPYFSDIIRYGATASWQPKWVDYMMAGLTYNSFGTFDRLDASGVDQGTFGGRSYIFQMGLSQHFGLFTMGTSLKFGGMQLENTSATLLLMDVGGVMRHPSQELVIGMSFRNMGGVLQSSNELQNDQLPFDVVVGISFKPTYMPFRFSMTAYDLPRLNEEVVPEDLQRRVAYGPLLRYVNPSVAMVLGTLMEMQLGYNYRFNETLRIENGGFGAGWSLGFKLLLEKYQILIARNTYQAAGGTTFISLQTNYNTIKNIF